jgi:hypothetical protein
LTWVDPLTAPVAAAWTWAGAAVPDSVARAESAWAAGAAAAAPMHSDADSAAIAGTHVRRRKDFPDIMNPQKSDYRFPPATL